MIQDRKLEDFLKDNRISGDVWQKSECEWTSLQKIGMDYEKHIYIFEDAAEFLVKQIKKINAVHSVRWRTKDIEHLLEKIVRKCAKGKEKYKTISVENYQEVVTDLVGIRALHLLKEDCFEIDKKFKETICVSSISKPIAYLKNGDNFEKKLIEYGFEIEYHEAGYRSIHYLLPVTHINLQFTIEIQVRTIFEEGWSEIDHKIRYPNFSDNPLVLHFLSIFNQIAGNADEIGSFVLWLNEYIENNKIQENETLEKIKAQENALRELEETVSLLQSKNIAENESAITKLKTEVSKLKASNINDGLLGLGRLNIDEINKTSIANSAFNAFDQYKTANGGLLGLGRLNLDEINKTSIANSAVNAFDQYKTANGGLLGLGRLDIDEISKTSITNSPINAFDQYKNELTKNANGGLLSLGRLNIDEMSKVSTITDAAKLHLHKEGLLGSALGLNDLVTNPLNKFKEDIAKTQKLAAGGMIDNLNNLNTCPKCFSKMQLSQCPICGFSR